MFINRNSATEQNLGFLPALAPLLAPVLGTAVSLFTGSKAAKAAKSAQKKQLALSAQQAKEQLQESRVQSAAAVKSKEKRTLWYITAGVASAAIIGAVVWKLQSKRRRG